MNDNEKSAEKKHNKDNQPADTRAGAKRSKQVIRKGGVTIIEAPAKAAAEEKKNS